MILAIGLDYAPNSLSNTQMCHQAKRSLFDASIRGAVACFAARIVSMVTDGAQPCQASAGCKNPRRIRRAHREIPQSTQSTQRSQVISAAGLRDFRKLRFPLGTGVRGVNLVMKNRC